MEQLVEAQAAHVLHRPWHGPDAGEHHAVGLAHTPVVGGELGGGAHVLERFPDRAEVAHPVVEDREAWRQRIPLVEGTPVSSGSSAAAARRARAKALKEASTMWCELAPASTRR